MSEFKGTPGPWFSNRFDVETDESYICSVADHHLDARFNSDEAELISVSNTNLIAAAPELLPALQGVVNRWTFGPAYNAPEFVAARAAISKALGEKP